MKKLYYLIISIIIIIVIMVICILFYLKSNQNKYNDNENINIIEKVSTQKKFNEVNDRNDYYDIKKILNKYIIYARQVYGWMNSQKYESDDISTEGKEAFYSILDNEYIKDMNIQKNDLNKIIKEYQSEECILNKLYFYNISDNLKLYYSQITIDNENLNLLIKVDNKNETYSVFLNDYVSKNGYSIDTEIQNMKIDSNSIERNKFNTYRKSNINDDYIIVDYIDDIKNKLISNPKNVYQNMLEQEYREKRFESLQNFINYINQNKEEIESIEAKKYIILNEKHEYIIQDQYDNYYVINEKAIMDYTIRFDLYTISEDEFSSSYKSATNEKKVQMNISKFIQMINRHDYKTAYSCLATSFKNNYTLTGEKFIEAVKNKFFTYNNVEYVKCDEVGNNTYAYEIKLTDLTGNNQEEKTITIIMKLNDEENFEMSFDIE